MNHIGINVHKKESQICILVDGGELIERRVRTEPRRSRCSARCRALAAATASPACTTSGGTLTVHSRFDTTTADKFDHTSVFRTNVSKR